MTKKIVKTLILLAVIGVFAFAGLNFRALTDIITGLGYEPTAEMSAIKSDLKLTTAGDRIFNASRPALEDQSAFNDHCDSHNADVSVLGCYDGQKIYIYNSTAENLAGIKQSTAAHELLHAVWSRLDDGEKSRLSEYLEQAYSENEALLEKDLSTYSASARLDELHARVGTEIKSLPAELEKHYRNYLADQDKIVDFYTAYITPFNELKAEIESLGSELEAEKVEIDRLSAEYDARAEALNAAVLEFNACAKVAGCFPTEYAFNARRQELVAEQAAVDNLYADLDAKIKIYNEKVNRYNDNILKNESLENLINSNAKVNNI